MMDMYEELPPAPIRPAVNSTDPKYVQWLVEWRANNNQRYRCYAGSEDAMKAFPELRRVRGWAHVKFNLGWDPHHISHQEHWWCEAPDGTIVDPTGEQWLDERGGDIVGYEEFDVKHHGPEPIGKCMECGMLVYASEDWKETWACSPEHAESLQAYYNIKR